MRIASLRMVCLVVCSLSLACGDDDVPENGLPDAGEDPLVTRGRYLVNDVSMCPFCHTPRREDGMPDPTRFLAGVDCIADAVPEDDEVGCINSRNLTNDETGLANATDAEIEGAIRDGIGTDGRNLIGLMPYFVFHNMTDDDVDSIIAYLRTVDGVEHMTPPNQPPFTEPEGTVPSIDPDDIPEPVDGFDELESAERGRYLATMVSLCIDCHTPETEPNTFMFDFSKAMAGGRAFPAPLFGFPVPPFPPIIYTSNLTPHETGLDGYDQDDIIKVMKEGLNPEGEGICAPTHSGPSSPFAGLTDDDVADIANYVLSLPPTENMIPEDCIGPPPS